MFTTRKTRRKMSAILIAAVLALGQLPAVAGERHQFNIERTDAAAAIHDFGMQTGLQVVADSGPLRGKQFNAVHGEQTTEDALRLMLAGTGLTHHYVGEHSVAILVEASSTTAHDEESAQRDAKGAQKKSFWDRFRLAQAGRGETASDASVEYSGPAENNEGEQLEVIKVTAQKRLERLQDVPISISVLGGEDLDRSSFEGVTEALTLVPGAKVTVGNQGGGTQVSLRGVSAGGPLFNGGSTVGYYIDAVPFGLVKTAAVPDSNAYDLQRVEVLRGPQGTLYGASALNGVIRVLTNPANLDAFELKARTTASATEQGEASYRGDMAINVPLVPGVIAARAVLGYNDLGGWIDRIGRRDANDGRIKNARLRINAQPAERFSIGLSAWLSRVDLDDPPAGLGDNTSVSLIAQPQSTDYDAFGLQLEYQFANFSVSSSTSYVDYANEGISDFAFLVPDPPDVLVTNLYSDIFAQEILLNSTNGEVWRWSVGGFYRDAEDRTYQELVVFLPAPIDFADTSQSFAVFGEITRSFLEGRLELTGGLRYFSDDVGQAENTQFSGNPADPLYRASETFDAISPRVVLTWHPGDNHTVYGSYSEGFRSGFNQNVFAAGFTPVSEDTLKNYEVGTKGSFFAGRVNFDAALYYIDWQDVQQTVLVELSSGVFATALINGSAASGPGFDLAVTIRPVDRLTLGLSGSWNDLTLDAPVFSQGVPLFDEGDRLNLSSEFTFGAIAEYQFPLGGGFDGRLAATAHYSSEQDTRELRGLTPFVTTSDDQLIARASFTLNAPPHWSATLFTDNANQERGSPLRQTVPSWNTRPRPRTWGIQVDYSF